MVQGDLADAYFQVCQMKELLRRLPGAHPEPTLFYPDQNEVLRKTLCLFCLAFRHLWLDNLPQCSTDTEVTSHNVMPILCTILLTHDFPRAA